MAKFVEFIDSDGDKVSVNLDLITKVSPRSDGGTHIAFGKDRGANIDADYTDVMDALRKA